MQVMLPNVSIEAELIDRMNEGMNELSKEEQKVVSYIIANNKINRVRRERLLNLKKTHAVRCLNGLIEKGIIIRVGGGKNISYVLRVKA